MLGISGATSGTFDSGKITYNAANGTLTLTGTDSVSSYDAALAAITYRDGGTDASSGAHPTRGLSWHVSDGILSAGASATSITIDRAPSIASGGAGTSLVAGGTISLAAGAALAGDSDLDGDSLTITALSGGAVGNPLSGTYGVLTLNADGSYSYSANNSAAIATAAGGSAPVDQFTFTVADPAGATALETLSIEIHRIPDFATDAPVTYTPGSGPLTVDGTGIVNDPDGTPITGARLYFATGTLPGDTLSFTPQAGITGSFASGTLTLTGTATAADYQTVLQSVQYYSTAGDPYGNGADGSRTLGIILINAFGESTPASASIAIDPTTIDIGNGSLVSLGTISGGRDAVFLGTGTLDLTSPADFAGSISSFGNGDTIVLEGLTVASETYGLGTLSLYDGLGTLLETLAIGEPAGITSANFHLASAPAGNTLIEEVTCFARGTRIATATGNVPVEHLHIGDIVQTQHAGPQPIKWIGTRHYAAPFCNHAKVLPVRITAGALADGVPSRDLLVSPGHAIAIDDHLIHAARLVNGASIVQLAAVDEIEYFHIELQTHEVILAENTPAETFLGEYFRPQFHNAASFQALYPGSAAPETHALPILTHGFHLAAIKRRLEARAGLRSGAPGALLGYIDTAGPANCAGWAVDLGRPGEPVLLDILAGDVRLGRVIANIFRQDVAAAGHGAGYCGFEFDLPAGIETPITVRRATDGAELRPVDAAQAA